MSNTITAYFKGRVGVAESVYQYDYGKVLVIDGLNLPATFEVHFTTLSEDNAITVIGQNNRAAIPNSCISIPGTVTAYIYLHTGENDGETEYVVKFAVIRRARPDYDSTDEEKSEFESAIQTAIAMLQNPKKINNPLDAYNQITYGVAGQLLRTKGDGSTEWVDVGLPTDEQTAQAVSDWLDAHPEATTTVQDGSLIEAKFSNALKLKTIKDYVTPEMYGAKGDGTTDDTAAWQSAVDSGFDVIATKPSYKCGKIDVTKNLTIDLQGASFTCTAGKLFDCRGKVVATVEGEADYTANQAYALANNTYKSYTGFAMLRGTNNFETSRDYYMGGFACEFRDGNLTTPYPVDVDDPSIDIIKPIRVIFKNVGAIRHTIDTDISVASINILYGLGCVIYDSDLSDSNGYFIMRFEKSLHCIVSNCRINRDLTTSDANQSYPLAWLDSSFCVARDCDFTNKKWHCITTGNAFLCYHNVVDNCRLSSNEQYAYLDHANAVNTIIKNTVSSCIGVAGMGVVENCVIVSALGNQYKRCWLNLAPPSNEDNAVWTVRDVKLLSASDATGNYIGVGFEHSAQVSGGTYYIKNAMIDNVKCYGLSNGGRMHFNLRSTNYVIKEIFVNNVNLNIFLAKTSAQTNIDITNYVLNLSNIIEKAVTNLPWLGYTSMIFNDVNCDNCNFIRVYGTYHDLTLRNVYAAYAIDEDAIVQNRFVGSGIRCRIASLAFDAPKYVNITDFVWEDGAYRYNVFRNGAGTAVYGCRWNAGAMQALAIYTPS